MKQNIKQEAKAFLNEIRSNVMNGRNVTVYLSGTANRKTKMYEIAKRYEDETKIDYELGVIGKEEFETEMEAIKLLERSIEIYVVF